MILILYLQIWSLYLGYHIWSLYLGYHIWILKFGFHLQYLPLAWFKAVVCSWQKTKGLDSLKFRQLGPAWTRLLDASYSTHVSCRVIKSLGRVQGPDKSRGGSRDLIYSIPSQALFSSIVTDKKYEETR